MKIEVCMHWLVADHESPLLGVMVSINRSQDSMMHVPVFRGAGHVEELKFQCLAVRQKLARHARSIAGIAIVSQHQAVSLYIKHGDGIVRPSCQPSHLMHERVSGGGHA